MINIKKNKLLVFFFIVGIIQIFYYWNKRSNFKFEVLKNPFKENSHIKYVLPETIIETNEILISNKIKKFNLSSNLRNDMYSYQRIVEFNYPIRFDQKSKYTIFLINENNDCKSIFKGKFIELKKCQ
tara:strand:- start:10328 stop:10708 length:381 start_codon:yes stop_codon:yes gene_type:complete